MSETIAEINDRFRKGDSTLGKYVTSHSVSYLSPEDLLQLTLKVQNFDTFTESNDPWGEHDFGTVEQNGIDYFWKIDYYDNEYYYHSEDKEDTTCTKRVLIIMEASEY